MRMKLAFKYRVSYSYARSGSIKPKSLNFCLFSFTKIRIQSTPKNKESTYNLVNHWLEHGAHTSDRTNERTSIPAMDSRCSVRCTSHSCKHILYRVAECIHLYLYGVCAVYCVCAYDFMYIIILLVWVCSLSSHRRNKKKLDRLCVCCVCTLANDVDCVPKINNKLFLC